MIKFRKAQARDEQRSCGRFIFKARRSPTQTMNALDEYLRSLGDEPARWLAREVRSWGNEFSYSELAAAIEAGNLDDLINWQERYAEIVNEKLAPMWAAAIAEASKQATRGMTVLSDSNDYVRGWINTHGGELITRLSDESRLAVMNVILRGQGLRMAPRDVAKEVRPLIGLNDRQAAANQRYKQEILQRYLERGMSESKAAERAEKAALKYAGKQHRYRAETIVLTENAFAYNRGAHMGVSQSIADGYMGRCAMIWTTAGTNRVCSRCLALKDTVVGYTDELGVLLPPLHPRCRCAIMYDEVGTRKEPGRPRGLAPKNIESKDFSELQIFLGKLDNLTVRKWYSYHDERIHELIDSSLPIEQKARQAFEIRNKYRTQARNLMADQEARRRLDLTDPNPTWEGILRHKIKEKGMSYEQAIEDIYKTATKSNEKVNRKLGLE